MMHSATRHLAAEHSFIATVPIMVAATGYALFKAIKLYTATDIPFMVAGFVEAFIAAIMAINGFIALAGRVSLVPFVIYRLMHLFLGMPAKPAINLVVD